MNHTYENEKTSPAVIYAEPIRVEDAPLPLHVRAAETVRRRAERVRQSVKRIGMAKGAFIALALMAALLLAPVLIPVMLVVFGLRARASAGAAF